MEYTVQKLGILAGISARALRYYDEIGILKPARINSSGYRIYGEKEVDRLQQILFYRELGVSLEEINKIINTPSFDSVNALKGHREKLLEKRKRLDSLICNVDKTIAFTEGGLKMSDKEKFEGFKKKMIAENEEKYGKEVRKRFGDDVTNKSNEKLISMTMEEHDEASRLAKDVMDILAQAIKTGDSGSDLAQKAAELHKKWLTYYWSGYTKEAHAGLAQMYVDDERFTAYYDKEQPGTAAFLRDAILIFTGVK